MVTIAFRLHLIAQWNVNITALLEFEHGSDKWIELSEHEFNSDVTWYKEASGPDVINDMVDTLNPRDSVKGGRTEVFRMYCHMDEPSTQCIRYFDVNSLYPYVMSKIAFPMGHPEIRRGHTSCKNLMDKLNKQGEELTGLCQVKILPPDDLFVTCLAHKLNNKLLFCLCRSCANNGSIQHKPCSHSVEQRAWIDLYTSIDI